VGGTLASLALRSRGIAPTVFDSSSRLGGRSTAGHFLAARSPHVGDVTRTLEGAGLLRKWTGRFGVLGGKGGFIDAASFNLAQGKKKRPQPGEPDPPTPHTDTGDFCGFLDHSMEDVYCAPGGFSALCRGVVEMAGIETRLSARVEKAEWSEELGKWRLSVAGGGGGGEKEGEGAPAESTFDAVIFAAHDPSLAASAISSISLPPGHDPAVASRLSTLSSDLRALRLSRTSPVITARITYPQGSLDRVPFDCATLPADPALQFLVREASKAGGGASGASAEGDLWTAVTTSTFAKIHVPHTCSPLPPIDEVTSTVVGGVSRSLAPFFGGAASNVPTPLTATAKVWRAGFTTSSLIPPTVPGEAVIELEPWRMAVAGDFVRTAGSPGEAAAAAGLAAGESVARWFGEQ